MKWIIGLFAAAFFILFAVLLAHAEVPIYCPKQKILLYEYQADEIPKGEILEAKDFKPVNEIFEQPTEDDPMVCPLCGAPLNGYEYWFWERRMSLPRLVYPAFTFKTKNKDGDFVWAPLVLNLESKKNR